jgi:tRNA G18 (ribose-2'-O)-methylase SpoU
MKSIYEILKSIEEKLLTRQKIEDSEFERLRDELLKLKDSDHKALSHLAKSALSVNTSMTLKDLMVFIVPIERHLSRRVTDPDFAVTYEDKESPVLENQLKVVLDNIRSAFNTGALFRTCEILGVSEVFLTGYTQGYESEQVLKTSMGAKIKTVKVRDLKEAKEHLSGYELVALETSKNSTVLYKTELGINTAFIVGNERFGLSGEDLKLCDKTVCLPTFGQKNSLNVNAALSACGYEWVRRFS